MTNSELSDTFTTLLNSYNTQAQFGEQASKREIVLDEYEKSVLLTQAQDIIVKSYFDGRLNSQGQGFDDSTRRQVDFSSLIKVARLEPMYPTSYTTAIDDGNGDAGKFRFRNKGDLPLHIVFTNIHEGETIPYSNVTYTEGDANIQGRAAYYVSGDKSDTLVICINGDSPEWGNITSEGSTFTIYSAITKFIKETAVYNTSLHVQDYIDFRYISVTGEEEVIAPSQDGRVTYFDGTLLNSSIETFDERGILYQMPEPNDGRSMTDVLFILNEKLIYKPTGDSKNKKEYVIVPINYKEYDREMSKPYAQPLKKQAWRLFQNISTGFDVNSELIPKWNIASENYADFIYKLRYVRRPVPIILEDLPDGLVIDGLSTESQCELNPILHMDILNKAVELAITTRGGGTTTGSSDTQRQ